MQKNYLKKANIYLALSLSTLTILSITLASVVIAYNYAHNNQSGLRR